MRVFGVFEQQQQIEFKPTEQSKPALTVILLRSPKSDTSIRPDILRKKKCKWVEVGGSAHQRYLDDLRRQQEKERQKVLAKQRARRIFEPTHTDKRTPKTVDARLFTATCKDVVLSRRVMSVDGRVFDGSNGGCNGGGYPDHW